MTTWPAGRIAPPHLEARPGVRVIDCDVLAIPNDGEVVALPEELYSRQLRDLDLDSPDAIAEFISRYGVLLDDGWLDTGRTSPTPVDWRWEMQEEGWRPIAMLKRDNARRLRKMKDEGRPPEEVAAAELVINATYKTERARQLGPKRLQATHTLVHCDEVRIAGWELRDMTRVFVEAAEGTDGSRALAAWESRHLLRPPTFEDALLDSAVILNQSLHWFNARVEVYGAEDSVHLGPAFDSFSVMCLQLFNDIAESAPWHTCQNATCGRPFRRQIGRARFGQYRLEGEVLYCSPLCAAAQRARVRRARIATASRHVREGLTPEQVAERMSTPVDTVTAEQVRGWLSAAAKRRKEA